NDDIDPDALISRLAGPLLPIDRAAFRAAAKDALAQMPCFGEGAAYRAVAALQRIYFSPPSDQETGRARRLHATRPPKLAHGSPANSSRNGGRERRRLRVAS